MPTQLAQEFRAELSNIKEMMSSVPPELADIPWRDGSWTRKQIVGHMLDSATNNRQRFVRAAIDGDYVGPTYGQDAWIAAHGYVVQTWATLLRWWEAEHEILAAVVDRIPEERLQSSCTVGDEAPVTLRYLIENYICHLQGHLKQLTASAPTT